MYDNVLAKSIQLGNYDVSIPFIDIRGMGEDNRETIREVLDVLEKYHESVEYDVYDEENEMVIRLDPDSLT